MYLLGEDTTSIILQGVTRKNGVIEEKSKEAGLKVHIQAL